MPVTVSYFGKTKPGEGVKPLRVHPNVKLPFGKKHPVNWWTGNHIPLRKQSGGGVSAVEIVYDTDTHELKYRTSEDGEWIVIATAVPEGYVST
jgi:hypothetical protein